VCFIRRRAVQDADHPPEDRQGHKPKLYEYCSTEIRHIVQRHVRVGHHVARYNTYLTFIEQFDGERDTKGPMDFGGSKAEDGGDDDDGDDDDTFSAGSPTIMRPGGVSSGMPSGMGTNARIIRFIVRPASDVLIFQYPMLTATQMHPSLGGIPSHTSGFPPSLERSRSNTVPSYHPGQKRPRLDAPVRSPYGFNLDMPSSHSPGHNSNVGSHSQSHSHYPSSTNQYPGHSNSTPSNSFALTSNSSSMLRSSANYPGRTGQLHAASFEMDNGFDWPVHHTGSTSTHSSAPTNQPRSCASLVPSIRPSNRCTDLVLIAAPSAPQTQANNSDPSAWLEFLGNSSSASPSAHTVPENASQGLALPMPNISGTRRPSLSMGPAWDRSHDGASTPRMGQGSHDATPRLVHDVLGKRDREGSGDGSSNGHGRGGGSPRIKRENMDDAAVAIIGGQA
jgi:transcription factor RLM1